jgi:hypothetical protein
LNVSVPVVHTFLRIRSNGLALVREIATGIRRACLIEVTVVKFHDGKVTFHIVFAVPAATATGDQTGETQDGTAGGRVVVVGLRHRLGGDRAAD